ncbi:hypothetical protein ACTXG9_04775 [Stenotrophomonas maltophilia group sp. LNF247]
MDCVYNCMAETGSVNWSAWIQTAIAAASVLVAAWVPTRIFRHDQQKAVIRERARARCAFALAMEPFNTQLLELFEIGVNLTGNNRDDELLQRALTATEISKEMRDALAVGHEFPSLSDSLVTFALRLSSARSSAVSTSNSAFAQWHEGNDPFGLAKTIEAAVEAGLALGKAVDEVLGS